MKLNNLTGTVAVLGGAVALYVFVKSGGLRQAQFDAAKATGGVIPKPAPRAAMGETADSGATFGVRNPWANDAIFAPYQPPTMFAGGSSSFDETGGRLTTGMFGVGLN